MDDLCEKMEGQQLEVPEELPSLFKTTLGKMVSLVGKPFNEKLASIVYNTSKLQGNVVLIDSIQDVEALLTETDQLYNDGFLDNDNMEECDSIILPIDGVNLSDTLKGVIIDSDLRSYTNGIQWLLDSTDHEYSVDHVLHLLQDFLKVMKHLYSKGIQFEQIDGHQFFFNQEYGKLQFIYDGVDMKKVDSFDDEYLPLYESAVSSLIMYMLTGTSTEGLEGLVKINDSNEDDQGLMLDEDTDTIYGSQTALDIWYSLPEVLRNTLYNVSFAKDKSNVSFDEWESVLNDSIADEDVCAVCGNTVFKTGKKCMCCGNTTNKSELLTQWEITSSNQPQYLKITFGRGTTLPGALLGIQSPESMRLMYNSKMNALGLKNLSNTTWFITKDENQIKVLPGSVMLIEDELEISFDGYPDVSMRFLGYEMK